MYSDQDLKEITSQMKKVLILLICGLGFFIVISIVIAKLTSNRIGMAFMIFGTCVEVFVLGMYGTPIFAYYRFIRDLTTGRSRNIDGLIKDITDKPIYKDNKLYFYEVTVEEDGVERILLLDQQKDWPTININRRYDFQIYENVIRELNQIG